MIGVTLNISIELCPPERDVALGCVCVTTSRMLVPKAPVNENDGIVLRQYDVRSPRQVAGVEPKSETLAVQVAADQKFWISVLAANAGHHSASRLPIHDVAHRSAIKLSAQAAAVLGQRVLPL
jgi:hypothetical protein